jgi:ferrous iron transport protein A
MKNKTLDKAQKGMYLTILSLPSGIVKVQLIRLGISIGDTVFCIQRLPGGTIVIQKNRQEIAIGYDLARKILIQLKSKNE